MDYFMNEIIDGILQFSKVFHQDEAEYQMNAGKRLSKVMVLKRNGYNS